MIIHGLSGNKEVPIAVDLYGRQDIGLPQKDTLLSSATLNVKTLAQSFKLYDTQNYSHATLLVTVTKTSAVGDGRIAIRGYVDAAQTISTPDLAVLDMNSTASSKLNVLSVTAGSTADNFIVQLKDFEFTALEVYVKAADTGTTVSAAVSIVAKGAH